MSGHDDKAARRARLRTAIEAGADLNGIDYAESVRGPNPGDPPGVLVVLFAPLPPPPEPQLDATRFHIDGGDRITGLSVTDVTIDPADRRRVTLDLDRLGDFSIYAVRIDPPPANFDPLFRRAEIAFRADCRQEVDCQVPDPAAPPPPASPHLDYLARDFASLRTMMLERMRVTAPHWTERNPADLGIALVELFAYVGDHLNYRLDAIDAEAYLATARRRPSARRHARLVDYHMHDGRNARAFVQIAADPGVGAVTLPARTSILSDPGDARGTGGRGGGRLTDDLTMAGMLLDGAVCYETMHDIDINPALNRIECHDWGLDEARLPLGATTATLRDPTGALAGLLAPGQFLVFEEALGIAIAADGTVSGIRADADPAKRWAVRLTSATPAVDPLGDPGGGGPLDLVEVTWDPRDALPFELPVSRLPVGDLPAAPGLFDSADAVQSASVARGGVALADEGHWLAGFEPLATVPLAPALGPDAPLASIQTPRRFQPELGRAGVVEAAPYDDTLPAALSLEPALREQRPQLELRSPRGDWTPQRDLIASSAVDLHFVVERENGGGATVRFGDNRFGQQPDAGEAFDARYRLGRGVAGMAGAASLVWVRSDDNAVAAARNPMAARGALVPESIDSVRAKAPGAFNEQKRAITADDYARFAERHPNVARAVATFRWTGLWRTVFVTVDLVGGAPLEDDIRDDLLAYLEPYRRAGHEVAIDAPILVPLALGMTVCVEPNHFRSDVMERLRRLFSGAGLFHPDRWTFGEPVYVSQLYAAAMSVPGVRHVEITDLRRQNQNAGGALDEGVLAIGRREVAVLENDPNFPGRGALDLVMEGGL